MSLRYSQYKKIANQIEISDIVREMDSILKYCPVSYDDEISYKIFKCKHNSISENEISLKEKFIYCPNCKFHVFIDLNDRTNYTALINTATSGFNFNYTLKMLSIELFDKLYSNYVSSFNEKPVFNFDNEDESNYIYTIVNLMLSVFYNENRKKSLYTLYNRSYHKSSPIIDKIWTNNGFDIEVSEFIEENKDISLVNSMYHCINYLSDVEYLVAIYHFNKYGLYNCEISKDDIDEYLKSGDLTAELEYLIDDFKNHLFEIYRNHLKDIQDVYNKKKEFLRETMYK